MLSQDYAIGNYVQKFGKDRFTSEDRELLMSILQDLNKKKEYKQETLHMAGSIADRYLKIFLETEE